MFHIVYIEKFPLPHLLDVRCADVNHFEIYFWILLRIYHTFVDLHSDGRYVYEPLAENLIGICEKNFMYNISIVNSKKSSFSFDHSVKPKWYSQFITLITFQFLPKCMYQIDVLFHLALFRISIAANVAAINLLLIGCMIVHVKIQFPLGRERFTANGTSKNSIK